MRPQIRRVLVDSSAFFALLDADDINHESAHVIFKLLADEARELLTTNLLVAEVYTLTQSRLGRNAAVAWINALPGSEVALIFATAGHHDQAMELLNRYDDKTFSYADAVSFVIAEQEGVGAAFSYDHHFAQYATTVGWELLG